MKPQLSFRLCVLFVAIHAALATWFAVVTPYRQGGTIFNQGMVQGEFPKAADIGAPDERQHANYVRYLHQHWTPPVFDPKDPNLYESYQSHQPPLFYYLEAAWSKASGANPEGGQSDGIRMRLLNVLIGSATVCGVFFLVLWGFKDDWAALAAAAFVAAEPMFVALSGAISNDPLLICLCTWVLAFLAKGFTQGWEGRKCIAIGLLLLAAFYTKTSSLPLMVAIGLAFVIAKPGTRVWALGLGVPVMLALPWWLRNASLYGDPLAMQAFKDAFQGAAKAQPMIDRVGAYGYWIGGVLKGTAFSFVGVFGYWDIWASENLYRIVLAVWGLIGLAWVTTLKSASDVAKKLHWVHFAFLGLVVLSFVMFNKEYFQAQSRYLMPAIGPMAAAMGLGVAYASRKRPALGLAIFAGLMVLLCAYMGMSLPQAFAERIQAGQP